MPLNKIEPHMLTFEPALEVDVESFKTSTNQQLAEMVNDYSHTLGFLNGLSQIRTRAILEVNGFYFIEDGAYGKYRVLSVDGTETWVDVKDSTTSTIFQISSTGEIRGIGGAKKLRVMLKQGEANVKLFGAKGDSIQNDTQTIQPALNFNTSFLTLYFPDGTYLLATDIIHNRQNLRLRGTGRGTTLYPSAGVSALKIATLNGVKSTSIENMRIYGQPNALGGISFEGNPVSFTKLHNVEIENFTAVGSFGIKLSQIQELDVFNCYLYQNYNHIWLPNVAGNYCTSTHIHGMAGYIGHAANLGILLEIPVCSFTVSQIVVEGNLGGGVAAIGKGTQVNFDKVHFEENRGNNTIYAGGTSLGKAKVSLKDCFFYANTAPILRLDYADSVISGNAGLVGVGNVVTDVNCDTHLEFNRAEDISQNQDAIAMYETLFGNVSYFETDTRGIKIQRLNGVKTFSDSSPPTTLTWKRGDRVFNSSPSVGLPKSWVCTVAGTPGTWVNEGNL